MRISKWKWEDSTQEGQWSSSGEMVFDDRWREGKEREENWSKCIYAVDESLSERHQRSSISNVWKK